MEKREYLQLGIPMGILQLPRYQRVSPWQLAGRHTSVRSGRCWCIISSWDQFIVGEEMLRTDFPVNMVCFLIPNPSSWIGFNKSPIDWTILSWKLHEITRWLIWNRSAIFHEIIYSIDYMKLHRSALYCKTPGVSQPRQLKGWLVWMVQAGPEWLDRYTMAIMAISLV